MNTNFWELSIYFPRELLCYFEDLKIELKKLLFNQKNCIDILIKENCYVFMIALEKECYNKNILYIKEKLAEIILLYYKPKTIINSINNFDMSNGDNIILIDILSSYETNVDKNFIVSNMSLIEKFYLDSFVKFKLNFLSGKWKEVANLINEHSLFLNDENIKKELMQFLMEGLNNYIHDLKLTSEGIFVNDNYIKEKTIFYSKNKYDNTLFTLINLYPQKIFVENYKELDAHFMQLLHQLFGSKLHLIS